MTRGVSVVQRDEVYPFDRSLVFAGVKVGDKRAFFRIAIRFIFDAVVYAERPTFSVQFAFDLVK